MEDGNSKIKRPDDQHCIDIYIIGTGITPGLHLTREAEAALRSSTEVLYVDKSFGIEELLSSYCKNITDLHKASYSEGHNRLDAYRNMASAVVNAALSNPPVTFALYGHPLVYSLPPFIVIAAAEALGLRVKTLAGISSLDTLFVDLRFDPCTQGVQMYEATDILLRQRPIQQDVPCFIWQIGAVESRLYSTAQSSPARFGRIKEYLLKFYPSDHRMIAVYSSSMPLIPSTLTEFTLDTIEEVATELHQGVTVFIPPVQTRAILDETISNSMDDSVHLTKMTVRVD
jgi:uncharacterized protein YabN with tetrapyrrole methylase and pyrophosphatase domain